MVSLPSARWALRLLLVPIVICPLTVIILVAAGLTRLMVWEQILWPCIALAMGINWWSMARICRNLREITDDQQDLIRRQNDLLLRIRTGGWYP